MERAILDDATLDYEVSGRSEPVVFIHGAFIADTFRPLVAEPSLADCYQLITYHRRGYAGSSRTAGLLSVASPNRSSPSSAARATPSGPASVRRSGCYWHGCWTPQGSCCRARPISCRFKTRAAWLRRSPPSLRVTRSQEHGEQ